MGTRRSLAFLVIVLLAPIAAAQVDVPSVPTGEAPALPTPPVSFDPTLLEDGPLLIQGTPTNPTLIRVSDPEGAALFSYELGTDGKARVLAGDEVVLDDATLARMDGAPTDDAFTLHLRDAEGAEHAVTIDRLALLADAPELPPIDVVRPPAWPGAPEKPYLLVVQDAHPNRLGPAQLDGTAFLRRADQHVAIVQMPAVNATFDRIALSYARNASMANATFSPLASGGDAAAYRALFAPGLLAGVQEGDTITLRVWYERRVTPLVVERFAEDASYRYRLDGRGPDVELTAPAQSNDFRFALAWSGTDDLTGVGGFAVDVRPAGSASWTRWLDGTNEASAVFSGDWGTTYEFRAFSLDGVGNPSQPATATVVVGPRPAGNDEINRAPTARLLAPAATAVLRGLSSVSWQASDPDGTPVTSRLEVSADDGATWRILYVGTGTSYAWHTSEELDGATYRLRLTVSDGTAQASDAASAITIDNVVATPASLPTTGGSNPGAPSGTPTTGTSAPTTTRPTAKPPEPTAEGSKGVPGAGLLVGVLAMAGAAMLARRRA